MSESFALGWRPDLEPAAKQSWAASGLPPRFTSSSFADARPLPDAFTLADLVISWFNQGPVGSCFANGSISSAEHSIAYAADRLGMPLAERRLSRRWAWYQGRRLDGLLGRGTDGGSITNVMRALSLGVPPEDSWPYKPDHGWLEATPTPAVKEAAKAYGLKGMLDLEFSDTEGIKRSIYNGLAPVPGIWWPYGWDQGSIDQYGRAVNIGRGTFGHALCIIGWVDAGVWDRSHWWHFQNSHGPIYPLPSPEMRDKVQGYASARQDRCYTFWVRDDLLRTVAGYGNAELVAPVGPYAPDNGSRSTWEDAWS